MSIGVYDSCREEDIYQIYIYNEISVKNARSTERYSFVPAWALSIRVLSLTIPFYSTVTTPGFEINLR